MDFSLFGKTQWILVCVSKEILRMLLWAKCILTKVLTIAGAECVSKGM